MIAVALFMIGTALALMDVHPMFRFFILEPPAFLLVRRRSKQDHWLHGDFGSVYDIHSLRYDAGDDVRHCQWVSAWGADPLSCCVGDSPLFFRRILYGMTQDRACRPLCADSRSCHYYYGCQNMNAGAILLGIRYLSVCRCRVYCVTFCDRFGVRFYPVSR